MARRGRGAQQLRHQRQADRRRIHGRVIGHVKLHPVQGFPGAGSVTRHVGNGPEQDSGQAEGVQAFAEQLPIQPAGADQLERRRRPHALVDAPQFADRAGHGVVVARLPVRDVLRGRNRDPAQVAVVHAAPPPVHRDDLQIDARRAFGPDHARPFPRRHAVNLRYVMHADERQKLRIDHRPADHGAAHRVRPVEHPDRHAGGLAGLHQVGERRDVGIAAAAHVLDVVQHGVQPFEHFRRRPPRASVQADDWQAGDGVAALVDLVARAVLPAQAVLGREQPNQLHARQAADDVDRRGQFAVHASGVGQQPQTEPLQFRDVIPRQHLDAGQ